MSKRKAPTINFSGWNSIHAAAKKLGITAESVSNACRKGFLIGKKFGRGWLVSDAEIADYLKRKSPRGRKPKATR